MVNENILCSISRVKQLYDTFILVDTDVYDKGLALAVLNGLSQTFQHLIFALNLTGDDDENLTYVFVKSGLNPIEQRMDMQNGKSSNPSDSALLVSRSSSATDLQLHHSTSNFKERNCGWHGYIAKYCWGRDANVMRPSPPAEWKAGQSWRSEEKTSFSGVEKSENPDDMEKSKDSDENDFCFLNQIEDANLTSGTSSWIFDSGCSTHMTF